MKLSAIEPSTWGRDLRTFACPHCKMVQRHIIESTVTEAWLAPRQWGRSIGHTLQCTHDEKL